MENTDDNEEHSIMAKAVWNGVVLAESDQTVVVEGNHYFPPESVKMEYFRDSTHHTTCPWKGLASYYTIEVDGNRNENAAWYYPTPKDAAKQITGRVAFWKGVQVTE
jgi:uncharacterized protein (DUF427 family)